MVAKAAVENFFWNLSLIPTQIELNHRANRYMKDSECFEKDKAKEEQKKAEKACKEDFPNKVSDTTKNNIDEVAEDDHLKHAQMIAKASDAEKLVKYAIYYMTNSEAKLIHMNDKAKQIVNAVADIFDFGKIYESEVSANLAMYDISCKEEYVPSSKYILSIKDIESRKNDPGLIAKVEERKKELNKVPQAESPDTSSYWQKGEDGLCHPIWVGSDEKHRFDFGRKGVDVSDELRNQLESKLAPLVSEPHRYELNPNGTVSIYISRGTIEEEYIIDKGNIMGGYEVYVLGKTGNDTIFVPASLTDVAKNVLSTLFYILTPDELQKVMNLYFRNMNIYKYVDMSNTDFIKDLKPEEFQKLGKKLSFIVNNMLAQSHGSEAPRLRFNMFNSIDDFLLISDNAVVSPLSDTGETSRTILEGLMFEVKGDNVFQRFMGTVSQLHIERYGDL